MMNRNATTANSMLWAAAMISAALLGAPTFFTIVLLPLLASLSLLLTQKTQGTQCRIST